MHRDTFWLGFLYQVILAFVELACASSLHIREAIDEVAFWNHVMCFV